MYVWISGLSRLLTKEEEEEEEGGWRREGNEEEEEDLHGMRKWFWLLFVFFQQT